MFSRPKDRVSELIYRGTLRDGEVVELPISDLYSYTRGFTSRRVPDDARFIRYTDASNETL